MKNKKQIEDKFLEARNAIGESFSLCAELSAHGYDMNDVIRLDAATKAAACKVTTLRGLMAGNKLPPTGEGV